MQDLFDKYGHPIRVLIDPDCPAELFDKSGRPHIVVENADGIDLSTSEFLAALLKGSNLLHIPTNAGWTETLAGSGVTYQKLTRLLLITGATVDSKALLQAYISGFAIGDNPVFMNWAKKLYIIFNYARQSSGVNGVARFQIKEANTEGALAAKGIGIRVDNLALFGESYGTELGEVNLGVTLTTLDVVQIVIIHYPGSKIEWYINGVLKGTQSTVAKIPSGMGGTSFLVNSIINGAAGGDLASHLHHLKLWQES